MKRPTASKQEAALTAEASEAARRPQVRRRPADVARLFAALEQNLLWLVLAPVVFVLATVCYVLLTSPSYEIGARLTLQYGRDLRAPTNVGLGEGQQVAPIVRRTEDAMGEVQLLKDPRLVREAVYDLGEAFFFPKYTPETLFQTIKHFAQETVRIVRQGVRGILVKAGLLPPLTPLEQVIVALEQAITSNLVPRSEVIEITLRFPDREGGEVFLNRYLDKFFKIRADMLARRSAGPLLEAEISRMQTALLEVEAELGQAREDTGVWSSEEQRRLLVQRLGTIETEHTRYRGENEAFEAEKARLVARLRRLETAGIEVDRLARKADGLRQRIARYTDALNEDRIDALTAKAQLWSVAVMSPPTAGLIPASPHFVRLVLIAAALGIVAAAGLVLLLDGVAPKARSDEDIQDFLPDATVRSVPNRPLTHGA